MPNSPTKISVLLFDGFSNLVLACLLEPLRALRDQTGAPIAWQVFAAGDGPVRSSSGLRISPDAALDTMAKSDLLLIVAGYGVRAHATAQTKRLVAKAARLAPVVIAADSAAWLVAAAGLLNGQRATTHWQMLDDFAEAFPDVEVSQARTEAEGRIWTCGAASTALDLVLRYIDARFGPARAFDVSAMFQHHGPGGGLTRAPGHGPAPLRAVLAEMARTLESPVALATLAQHAGLSLRSLNRLFQAELGMSPGKYYQLMRLARARDLAIETDLPLQQIALRAGFASGASLAKAFKAAFGHPIGTVGRQRPWDLLG